MTETNFEEPQFFSTQYDRGLDWYLQLFNNTQSSRNRTSLVFEKSANYFSHAQAPRRIRALLQDQVKLIVLTIDPIRRAYSWYQVRKS